MDAFDIDVTAKYGDQLLSIFEKMTHSELRIVIKVEDKEIVLSKDEYVKLCKESILE